LLLDPIRRICCRRTCLRHGANRRLEARAFVAELARSGERLPDPTAPRRASRDPNDDYLVALAKVAGVRALVSGDRDLTEMPDADPPVLTPR
jgi:uncharacterized protein